MKGLYFLLGSLALVSLLQPVQTAEPIQAQADEDFKRTIAPILSRNCLQCHGGDKVRSGLLVTSRESLVKGGERGPAIVPGEPEKSLLIQSIRYTGKIHMPPKAKLDASTIETLAEWIKKGAPWPKNTALPPAPPTASEDRPTPPGKIVREPHP